MAKSRRLANQKKEKVQIEDVAKGITSSLFSIAIMQAQDLESNESGLVISSTAEFVNNLATTSSIRDSSYEKEPIKHEQKEVDIVMQTQEDMEEEQKEDYMDQDEEPKEEGADTDESDNEPFQEPLVSRGLAATISMLSQKGIIEKRSQSEIEIEQMVIIKSNDLAIQATKMDGRAKT